MDDSHGYEAISADWLTHRGSRNDASRAIGVEQVRRWAQTLPPGSSIVDVGCGPGVPLTTLLVEQGLQVYAVDAAPSFVAAFQQNLPEVPVACASALEFDFFHRTFDAVLAVGLIFLMTEADQRHLLRVLADRLNPNGRLLFTAPVPVCRWADAMTGLPSVSLGADAYRMELNRVGLSVVAEFEDTGGNHYFNACKTAERQEPSTEA